MGLIKLCLFNFHIAQNNCQHFFRLNWVLCLCLVTIVSNIFYCNKWLINEWSSPFSTLEHNTRLISFIWTCSSTHTQFEVIHMKGSTIWVLLHTIEVTRLKAVHVNTVPWCHSLRFPWEINLPGTLYTLLEAPCAMSS